MIIMGIMVSLAEKFHMGSEIEFDGRQGKVGDWIQAFIMVRDNKEVLDFRIGSPKMGP